MTNEDIAVKLAEHGKEIGSLKHRITDCEDSLEKTNELVQSVQRLAINMDNMLKELQKQGERLDKLEQEPGEDLRYYRRTLLGCLVTGVAGVLLGAVLNLL